MPTHGIRQDTGRSWRRRLLGISMDEIRFERRGFRGRDAGVRDRVERIGAAFLAGYHAALEAADLSDLEQRLGPIALDMRGFSFEGAAMGLALLDWLTPWRRDRVERFLQGAGGAHPYVVTVGVGWVWARVPARVQRAKRRLDPLLRWLAVDGFGFHEGFFHGKSYLAGRSYPRQLTGYDCRAFDQGLGRCLWFLNGGDADWIAESIQNLAPNRRSDLWSGVGLAATYAGEVDESALRRLIGRATGFEAELAQGSAFGAKARLRGGIQTPYTEMAVRTLCGLSATQAAQLTDDARVGLPADGLAPAFEIWRQRVQAPFRREHPSTVSRP